MLLLSILGSGLTPKCRRSVPKTRRHENGKHPYLLHTARLTTELQHTLCACCVLCKKGTDSTWGEMCAAHDLRAYASSYSLICPLRSSGHGLGGKSVSKVERIPRRKELCFTLAKQQGELNHVPQHMISGRVYGSSPILLPPL